MARRGVLCAVLFVLFAAAPTTEFLFASPYLSPTFHGRFRGTQETGNFFSGNAVERISPQHAGDSMAQSPRLMQRRPLGFEMRREKNSNDVIVEDKLKVGIVLKSQDRKLFSNLLKLQEKKSRKWEPHIDLGSEVLVGSEITRNNMSIAAVRLNQTLTDVSPFTVSRPCSPTALTCTCTLLTKRPYRSARGRAILPLCYPDADAPWADPSLSLIVTGADQPQGVDARQVPLAAGGGRAVCRAPRAHGGCLRGLPCLRRRAASAPQVCSLFCRHCSRARWHCLRFRRHCLHL